MGRKLKYSKEAKIHSCKNYEESNLSFKDISRKINATTETVRRWYLTYKEHEYNAFETSNKNNSYNQDFKLSVIKELKCMAPLEYRNHASISA